ncbi:neuraminidase-like domain-containing protein [Bradyrhizobium sp. CCBAU 11361]|uniref:Tc toxin subunit A-related protein n=1 Tax=Bradyrhizobium sp. CCBAU 11361 TaxID=1630812 RepID=UPI0023065517|nr:neuraminidase-like domain-containing protein [Bradyrhizobium sp. CCBAU 11361]
MAVVRLHRFLLATLQQSVPSAESQQQLYGSGTAELVAKLQEEIGIRPAQRGVLDAATADAVNLFLFSKRTFNRIKGRVTDQFGRPVPFVVVRVTDKDNLGGSICAETVTDRTGAYEAYYDPSWYQNGEGILVPKDAVEPVVTAHERNGRQIGRSAAQSTERDIVVDFVAGAALPGEVVEPAETFVVRGTVVDELGRGVNGLSVRVVDRDVGSFVDELGTVETAARNGIDGAFQLSYDQGAFHREEGPIGSSADLVFHLVRGDTPIELVGLIRLPATPSDLIAAPLPVPLEDLSLGIVARRDELVQIVVNGIRGQAGITEYQRLVSALKPLTGRVPLAEFDEAKTRDISFAARETGESFDRINDIVQANLLAGSIGGGKDPSVFYAIARHLGSRTSREIGSRSVAEIVSSITAAVDAATIPPVERIDKVAEDIHRAAVAAAIRSKPASNVDSLGDLLSTVIDDERVRDEIVVKARNAANATLFWNSVEGSGLDRDTVADLRYTLQLGTLTSNNVALTNQLRAAAPAARSLRELALVVGREKIAELVAENGRTPRGGEDGLELYANEISGLLEGAHPTAVVARLARDWSERRADAVLATTADLLGAAVRQTSFDIVVDNLDSIADANPGIFQGINNQAEQEAALEGARRLVRLFKISTDTSTFEKMSLTRIRDGRLLRGAMDVSRFSKKTFVDLFPEATPDEQLMLAFVHDKSRAVADSVSTIAIGAYQDQSDVAPAGALGAITSATIPSDPVERLPPPAATSIIGWEDMFGGAGTCECDDCRSVVGPAAYLVDLFEFLDKRCSPNSLGVTPLDVLIGHPTKSLTVGGSPGITGRRPDLAHIKLSCANTNTTIPTIDLINEILESVVATGSHVPLKPFESTPGISGPELSAAPENVVGDAYNILSTSFYPISLPYDRLTATARVQFVQAGTSRAEIIRAFGQVPGDADAQDLAWTMERLGLLSRDYQVLAGDLSAVSTRDLFGGDQGWIGRINKVGELLKELDISFEQLIELLRTAYVGGEVPSGDPAELMSRIFLDVDQLKELSRPGYVPQVDDPIGKALELGNLSVDDVRGWLREREGDLSEIIVLQPPVGCDPEEMVLKHLDGSALLKEAEWRAIHCFVRLAKRMKVQFAELDTALRSLKVQPRATLNGKVLADLAELVELSNLLKTSLAVTSAVVADIDTRGASSLYDTLFPPLGFARVYQEFSRGANGSVFWRAHAFQDGVAGLAAAFETATDAIAAIGSVFGLTDLNIGSVSTVYRVLLLAKAVPLEPVAFAGLASRPGECSLSRPATLTPRKVLDLVDGIRALKTIGATPALLNMLEWKPGVSAVLPDDHLLTLLDRLIAAMQPLHAKDEHEAAKAAGMRLARHVAARAAGLETPPRDAQDDAMRRDQSRQRRTSAAVAFVVDQFDLPISIVEKLLISTEDGGVAQQALLTTNSASSIDVLIAPIDRANPAAVATVLSVLRSLDRVSAVIKAAQLNPAIFSLAAGDAACLPVGVIASAKSSPDGLRSIEAMLTTLPELLNLVIRTNRANALQAVVHSLAQSGWSQGTLDGIAAWLDARAEDVALIPRDDVPVLADAAARKAPIVALAFFYDRLRLIRRVGVSVKALQGLTKDRFDTGTLAELTRGVAASFARSAWLELSRQMSDPIREQSRDALVAFLLRREKLSVAEELFDRFLIDTGTNAFVLTARIRQAMFAVQIFVQRCLLGFERENGVWPNQIDAEEWKVISRHQVWAARNKTLLYPEDLLDPSWRDNKSAGFKSFESTLQQGDATPANVELAFRGFMDDLVSISALEVVGTFLQDRFDGREALYFKSVVHVVGRTRGGTARKYYYRRLNRYEHHEEWTTWEPIGADIEGIEPDRQGSREEQTAPALREAGVHVLPVVWKGQVYLFWPTFMQKHDKKDPMPVEEGTSPRPSDPYWDIKICWTTKQAAGWSARQQSAALFETWWIKDDVVPPEWDGVDKYVHGWSDIVDMPQAPDPANFSLKAVLDGDSLSIILATRKRATGPFARARFRFSRSVADVSVEAADGPMGNDHFRMLGTGGSRASFMGVGASGDIKAITTVRNPDGDQLFSTEHDMRITTLNQGYPAPFVAPMFLDLADRSYFAQSSLGTGIVWEEIKESNVRPGLGVEVNPWEPNIFISVLVGGKGPAKNPWVAWQRDQLQALAMSAMTTQPSMGRLARSSVTSFFDLPTRPLSDRLVSEAWKKGISVGSGFRAVDVPALDVKVTSFYHPFAEQFSEVLRRDGMQALLTLPMQASEVPSQFTFRTLANPQPSRVDSPEKEKIDFNQFSSFGNYNWELFFHAPVTLVTKLMDNGQHDAAIELLHQAIYTPFADKPEDCWRFEGLRDIEAPRLDVMLSYLSLPDGDPRKENVRAQVDVMRLHPFQAHRIARLRPLAYKKWVVALDVKLPVALGDRYFKRFTPEDVNQAIQYYMIAYREMGKKPEVVPPRTVIPDMSYAELRPRLDAMGNVMFALESKLSDASGSSASGTGTSSLGIVQRGTIGYFGIPQNEKLLALWDLVDDRLSNIRNGRNIDGVQIQLPLYAPKIDPALLAEAVAAGLDISAVLDVLGQPLPSQRYGVMYRRAVELAEHVARLCDALLTAQEKSNNEALARKRAAHEREVATLLKETRLLQVTEAEKQRDALIHEEDALKDRYFHFADLLDARPQATIAFVPQKVVPVRQLNLVDADKISFDALNVIPDLVKVGAFLSGGAAGFIATVADENAQGVKSLTTGKVLEAEKMELEASFEAVKATFDAAMLDTLASILGLIPNFEAAAKPLGAGVAVHLGGQFFAAAAGAKARNKRAAGEMHTFVAGVHRKQGELILRERSWAQEMNDAASAILQVRRRTVVADIQLDLAHKAVEAVDRDLAAAEDVEAYLVDKFSSMELYDWSEKRLRSLFKDAFALALETAQMAEACFNFEREPAKTPFLRMSPPADKREELMAAHELVARLHAMDRAYNEAPRRAEFTRTVSLRQINPFALDDLREQGEAKFHVPDVLFDFDHPGYFDRRIKSVEVSIPCVAGPYSPVTGTLTLAGSRRKKRQNGSLDDDPVTAASIGLSSSRSDSGLFELSMQDSQYLPFEGMGLDSNWTLSMPEKVRSFDYWSIADVAITFRYTAKRGSDAYRNEVANTLKAALNTLVKDGDKAGAYQLVSVRHDLPDAWQAFKTAQGLNITLTADMLPYIVKQLEPSLKSVRGRVRLRGQDGATDIAFKTPSGNADDGWKVDLVNPSSDALATPKNVADILLFAQFDVAS